MTGTIMGIIFAIGILGAALGAFFTVLDWRARGPRYLSTLVLAAGTLGFSGWYLWGHEPPRKPKGYEEVKNRVVKGFTSDQATRLEISRRGKTVALAKKDGQWMLTQPVRFPADQDEVENLLTEIKMLDRDKTLPGPRTKAEYGFEKSPIKVVVEGATPEPLTLTIGGSDVTGAKVYLAKNDADDVLVVNEHIREAFDKEPGGLRDTAALRFKPSDVKRLQLTTRAGKSFRLARADGSWTLRVGREAYGQRANQKTVEELIRKLQDLRATRFVADGKAALAKHGLDEPQRTLVVHDGKPHTLLLGGPCPGRREDRLAGRRGEFPAVFCVRAKELQALLMPVADLRDARLVGVKAADVQAIHVQAGGKELRLERQGLDWDVKKPAKSELKRASADQVEEFIRELRSQTVLTFLPPPEQGLGKLGLDKPRAVLTLETTGGRKETLKLGAQNEDQNYYAQRSGEKLVVVIHRKAGALLSPSVLRFRDRNLLSFAKQPNEAVEITATEGTLVERVVYEGGLWRMKKPLEIKADADAIDAMLSVLSQLKAKRFVAERPQAAHGLTVPSRTLKILLEKEDLSAKTPGTKKKETHVIKLGADAPKGGCYGQLRGAGQPVFLLEANQCRDLRLHLVTRRLADIRTGQVQQIKLTRGGGVEHLERRGARWGRKGGPLVSTTAVKGLLTTLASLRATRVVRYGAPTAAQGLQRPILQVELVMKGEDAATVVLRIGAALKENNRVVGHYAVREGRSVVYLLGLPAVESIQQVKL